MTNRNKFLGFLLNSGLIFSIFSCSDQDISDAYGNFEATTVTVSAKGNGELKWFDLQEGMTLKSGFQVGLIDTTRLYLEKVQLEAQIGALDDKLQEAEPEIAVLFERKENLLRELNRTKRLLKDSAATQKQLDDYQGKMDVINQQINTTKRLVSIQNRGVLAERKPLKARIDVLKSNINDQMIINPIEGTILSTYAEAGEFVAPGAPLYKIANLETLKLRAYTSAMFLSEIELGDSVTVLVDKNKDDYRELRGQVVWIAEDAEFTPENIQTKEERVTLVYAIDVLVKNDGKLKIGMPGEVLFQAP